MIADSTVAARSLRQGTLLLDRIERSLENAGLERWLDRPQALSSDEIARFLEAVDFSGALGAGAQEALADLEKLDPGSVPARDASFTVQVSPDGLTAEASVTPALGSGRRLTLDEFLAALCSSHQISHGIDRVAAAGLLEASHAAPARAVIARGTAPVPGRAESWAIAPVDTQEAALPTDRVDFHARTARRAVAAGDRIALREAPDPGIAGRDVRGRIVPPPPPAAGAALEAGAGTERRGDGIFATLAGELRMENQRVCVVPILRIDGDVDFSSGNVDFPGNVVIKGSVLDDFVVRAAGDIEIGGAVHGACIHARGSVVVHGGIVGRDKGSVSSERDVEAKFIESAKVEARGSMRVRKGILHSRIAVLGSVEVTEAPGAVAGGEMRVGSGLRCRVLGAASGVRTTVHFGEDYVAHRNLEAVEKGIHFLRDRAEEVERAAAPARHSLRAAGGESDPEFAARSAALRARLARDLRRLMACRVALLADAGRAPRGDVRVSDDVHPGVVIASRGVERPIAERHVHCRFRRTEDQIEVCAHE